MDLHLLKNIVEEPQFEGMSNSEITQLLNAQTIEYWIHPATSDVQNLMFANGSYMKLLAVYRDHEDAQVRVAAEAAIDTVTGQIPVLNIKNNPNIQNMLHLLVYKGVFTQQDADDLNNFARRVKSRAEDELGGPVELVNVNCARLLDKLALAEQAVSAAEVELQVAHQLVSVQEAVLEEKQNVCNQLRSGIDVEVN
jgi:hypothetical protein